MAEIFVRYNQIRYDWVSQCVIVLFLKHLIVSSWRRREKSSLISIHKKNLFSFYFNKKNYYWFRPIRWWSWHRCSHFRLHRWSWQSHQSFPSRTAPEELEDLRCRWKDWNLKLFKYFVVIQANFIHHWGRFHQTFFAKRKETGAQRLSKKYAI